MNSNYAFLTILTVMIVVGTTIGVLTTESQEARKTSQYVGQETCMSAGCHNESKGAQYPGASAFLKTMHNNIHRRPTPENVVIDRWFREERTIEVILKTYSLFIDLQKGEEENSYQIQLRTTGEHADSTGWMNVAYTYGGNGWLQRFLIEVDGSYYPVPFQYALPHYRETHTDTGKLAFNNLDTWLQVDNDLGAIVFHKRNSQEFFDGSWDNQCSACHVNGFDVISREITPGGAKQWVASWAGSESSDSAAKDINIA